MAAEQLRHFQQQTVPKRTIEKTTPQRKNHSQVVKKPYFTKGEKLLYSIGVLIITVVTVMVVHFSSSIDTLNRDLQVMNNKIENVKLQNNNLSAEVKELSKPSRISAIARENGLNIKNANVKQASNLN
ncbi:cell division protein FtsL [Bacillaceae bacterium W0354]